ncbi:MAG: DUF4382 domain-containing protein [Proteobacteria bacterium]|nr:DUF4382 domain-containing protein [Pseudomonadota bacterium]MBU1714374.1 DUF4382 domain-containing protein [Pseudomonadota bacterium]
MYFRQSIHLLASIGILAFVFSCGGGGSSNLTSNETTDQGGISSPATNPSYISESGTDGTTTSGGTTATTVKFYLTDAPADPAIESAIVTLSGVTVHGTGGGQYSVMDEARTLDLLDLQNGVTTLLGEITLEPNKYTQIRMLVESGEVVSGGTTYPVEIPSGEIKINHNIDICSGGEVEIVIDFDAEQSLSYNSGRDLFTMRPVVMVQSVNATCPDETPPADDTSTDDSTVDEDVPYEGTLGWFSIVVPPVTPEVFSSLTGLINDLQVHDQGIGQVKTFTEDYTVNLLEADRTVSDPETEEALYTVLLPPVQIPAGVLDQIRLLFESIDAVDAETGGAVSIQLPPVDEAADPPEEPGLKFFGSIEVCENSLTILKWNLDLSAESLTFGTGDTPAVVKLNPVIQDPEVISTCEEYPPAEDSGTTEGGGETGAEGEVVVQ